MKVTQSKLPASQIGLEIEIPPELSKQSYEKVIREFSRSANIPGFRKGKVPRPVLLQRLGTTRIKAAAVEQMIQDCLEKAIEQEKIDAMGNYQLRSNFDELITQFEPGVALTFSASVDIPPQVTVGDYKGLQVKAEEIQYDPEDVEKFLEEQRQEQGTLIPVEGRPVQFGDQAVLDYSGKLVNPPEGVSADIPGGAAENYQMEIAPGRFIEGFVEGIVGMNLGETKEISVDFPDDYANADLAGQAAKFTITVKELKEKELPELDDDFAQAVSEYETLAELRESVESDFKAKAEAQMKANKHDALKKALLEKVEVEVPETMINQEVDNLLMQAAMQLQRLGVDVKQLYTKENLPQLREKSRPEAIDKIKLSLAIKEVIARESLEVEPTEVENRIAEVKTQVSEELDLDRLQEVVKDELLQEKALDLLADHAQIELVPPGTLATDAAAEEHEEADDKDAESEPMASSADPDHSEPTQ
jgi:trigger factor